jgi:hypothetical protein
MERNPQDVTEKTDTSSDITDRFEVESNVESEVKPEKADTKETKEDITPEQEPKKEPPEVKPVNPRTLARRAEKERLIRENAVMAEKLKQLESAKKEPEAKTNHDPSIEPSIDDFEDVFDYNKAVMKHELYLHNKEQEIKVSKETEQKQLNAFMQRAEIVRTEKPDFDERVSALVQSDMLTPDIEKAMLSSEMSADISYHLSQYGADLMTLRGLPANLLPKAIKSIEAFIKEGSTPQEKPRITQAAPPITPPGSTTKTDRSISSYSQEEIEQMPLAEYNRIFNKK